MSHILRGTIRKVCKHLAAFINCFLDYNMFPITYFVTNLTLLVAKFKLYTRVSFHGIGYEGGTKEKGKQDLQRCHNHNKYLQVLAPIRWYYSWEGSVKCFLCIGLIAFNKYVKWHHLVLVSGG